jgi:hypothetical protein
MSAKDFELEKLNTSLYEDVENELEKESSNVLNSIKPRQSSSNQNEKTSKDDEEKTEKNESREEVFSSENEEDKHNVNKPLLRDKRNVSNVSNINDTSIEMRYFDEIANENEDQQQETSFLNENENSDTDEREQVTLTQVARRNSKEKNKRITYYLKSRLPFNLPPVKYTALPVLLGFFLIIVLTILPFCVYSIGYNKIALARSRLTGRLDDRKSYEPGLHMFLPWTELIYLPKSAHYIEINELKIFTTDKLKVNAYFRIFYFLE